MKGRREFLELKLPLFSANHGENSLPLPAWIFARFASAARRYSDWFISQASSVFVVQKNYFGFAVARII